MKTVTVSRFVFLVLILDVTKAFQWAMQSSALFRRSKTCLAAKETKDTKKDNKAMAFLRKKGKVGGSANMFTNSMGVDEGPVGKTSGSPSGVTVRLCARRGVIANVPLVLTIITLL